MTERGFRTLVNTVPRRKQVFMIDYDPVKGRETPGRHPALIISATQYNHEGMAIVVAASHSKLANKYAVEIPLERSLGFDGFFHPDQVRTIDYRTRQPQLLGIMPDDIFDEILQRLFDVIDQP